MSGTNGTAARSFIMRHWQIIVAVAGIVWVGSADASQIKETKEDVSVLKEQYPMLIKEIGVIEGKLDVVILASTGHDTKPAPRR